MHALIEWRPNSSRALSEIRKKPTLRIDVVELER
jgi:hypothetical protein